MFSRLSFTLYTAMLWFLLSGSTDGQVAPWQADSVIKKGINLGNTLEPPLEGGWNNPAAQEYYFDMYHEAGFECIRIPVRWDEHTQDSYPYHIDESWIQRVNEIVDWGLSRGLYIIINAHHEDWIKTNYSNAGYRERFDSIWAQISYRFKDKSEKLFYEIINEPYGLTKDQNDELHQRILSIIRKTNPTRIVIIQGHNWGGSDELVQMAIPADTFLIGSFHSYDPYTFGLLGEGTWGTSFDYALLENKFSTVNNWSVSNNIPVILGEFGSLRSCDYNSRMKHYKAYMELSHKYGFIPCAWDDGGDFRIMERQDHAWDEVKDILVHTSAFSPKNPALSVFQDTIIHLEWINPANDYDSIFVERKTPGGTYSRVASIKGDTASFYDINPVPNSYYHYRVIAHYDYADDLYSHPVRIYFPAYEPKVRLPFLGYSHTIPGTIEAEDFDKGGEGLSYHDSGPTNLAGAYRPLEAVDIYDRLGDGYHIGNALPDEWYEYSVNIEKDSTYMIQVMIATTLGGGKFIIAFDSIVSDTLTAVNTYSQLNTTAISTIMNLPKGEYIMRFTILDGPIFNIDKYTIMAYNTLSASLREDIKFTGVAAYQNSNKEIVIRTSDIFSFKQIKLYSLSGEMICAGNEPGNRLKMPSTGINPGLYIVQAIAGTGILTKKIFIQ
ncbi:MAG: cellulase family glycosylhydrolase [Bacteroidales bacterium]|nr:cellulase family glycosylhydrolase [Bacteroidales bacterium]